VLLHHRPPFTAAIRRPPLRPQRIRRVAVCIRPRRVGGARVERDGVERAKVGRDGVGRDGVERGGLIAAVSAPWFCNVKQPSIGPAVQELCSTPMEIVPWYPWPERKSPFSQRM